MVQQVTSQSERNVRGRVEKKGEKGKVRASQHQIERERERERKREREREGESERERERERDKRDKRETQGELKLDSAI